MSRNRPCDRQGAVQAAVIPGGVGGGPHLAFSHGSMLSPTRTSRCKGPVDSPRTAATYMRSPRSMRVHARSWPPDGKGEVAGAAERPAARSLRRKQ
mmetsp:Transcript_84687/g.182538  ORF Transcript_84687/g.182538 Transcript_84687/m.182538 type:complete len:96 (+) Transcript_84687:836-1123(+)